MGLILCILSDGILSFTMFRENISKGFGVIERTRFPYYNFQYCIILSKMKVEFWYLFFAQSRVA